MALSQGPGLTSSWGKALLWSNWNADPDLAPIFRHTLTRFLVSDLCQLLHFLERAQNETATENTPGPWAELDQDFAADVWTLANKHLSQWSPNLFRISVSLELIWSPSGHSCAEQLEGRVELGWSDFSGNLLDGAGWLFALHETFPSSCAIGSRRGTPRSSWHCACPTGIMFSTNTDLQPYGTTAHR